MPKRRERDAYLFAMEGHFFALQMLLMLLGTAYIASACSCEKRTFDSYFCDSNSSVIKVKVISAENVSQDGKPLTNKRKVNDSIMMNEIRTKYVMRLERTFQTGSNEISTFKSSFKMIALRSASRCGFVLDTNTDYLLSGNTDLRRKFSTNLCNVIIRWDEVTLSMLDLLKGLRAPICENTSNSTVKV
ncbi:hypothetical protein ACJMK2_033046 [Sinanodonta woodiana]|uniref:NTR domain-containing protein n=1 Tax=Sinanodonta woodiana TaxID=1069815 RepID=A0ABD3X5C4_SINWO